MESEWKAGTIGARLLAAEARRIGPEALAGAWFCQRIEARLPGLGGLARAPDLLPRVRGAFGAGLMEGASRAARSGAPCPWRPPCALDVFFGPRPRVRMGRHLAELPAPWALTADAGTDGALLIGLHVFGFACEWTQAAGLALVAALERRLRWREVKPGYAPPGRVEVADLRVMTLGAPLPEAAPEAVVIGLLTPMDSATADILERPESFFSRLAARVSGLARWHDCALEADWGRLATLWRDMDYEFLDAGAEEEMARRSARQGRRYWLRGRRVLLRVAGELAPLVPFLAMGETAHAGRKAAFGMGRFAWEGD